MRNRLYECQYCHTRRESKDEECCDAQQLKVAVRVMRDLLDTMETPRSQKASKAWMAAREFVDAH